MSKSILIVCPYPYDTVPGQRLKYEQYFSFFRKAGYDITVHPFFSQSAYNRLYKKGQYFSKTASVLLGIFKRLLLLPSIRSADGLYIFLNVVPVGPPWLEWLYAKLSKAFIYDIDDMVHLRHTTSANNIARFFKSSSRYYLLMRSANHVISCTPTLYELASKYNNSISDISSTIDTSRYVPKISYSNDHILTIGWSGSHSTSPYLRLLDDIFIELSSRYRFKLLIMGSQPYTLSGVDTEFIPWSVDVELPTLQRFDIGVYPLPNNDWVLGKSGLKALQYMALGVPTVATNFGCTTRIIHHGHNGFLVNQKADWISCLSQLLDSPHMRSKLGSAGRSTVDKHFSVKANAPRYLSAFASSFN